MSKPLEPERLREVLDYNPETGTFTWLKALSRRIHVGERAGTFNHDGYRIITIDKVLYRAARLAWFYVHSKWPDAEIDHINAVRDDDRIENLREATREENLAFARARAA